ncbi:MAG: pyridoxal phosphate-dependent aminotransferase [Gammaproteobacteria bacterium]|nr:pyridoxal phosphate-dependent aminotransferase [Gammaproteobacteria bacterium]
MKSIQLTSERSSKISPSKTLSISALSNKLRAEGKDIANLAVGQPDFPTPDYVKQAAVEAIAQNKTGYTAVDGIAELKEAIVRKTKRDSKLDYETEQIIVSCGAKHSLYNVCQAALNKGDEVIVPAPFWNSYPDIIKLAEGVPVTVTTTTEQGFKITAEQLQQHINERTRMLLLNSPNNPSGSVYTAEELTDLAEVLIKHPQVIICSDDIYEHFVFDGNTFSNILNVCPELYPRCLIVNGVSKAYAMTGWRIGWTAGPADLITAMKKIQSQSTSNPCSISQAASQAALENSLDYVYMMRDAFAERRDYLASELNDIDGITLPTPAGSFYAFADFSEAIARHPDISDDLELSKELLNQTHVSTVPGIAFGIENHLRLSLAVSTEELQKAVERIRTFLAD